MKNLICLFFLLFFIHKSAVGQNVEILKWEELNKKITQIEDTTIVLNFWATWCKPCLAELPDFERFNKENQSTKIQVWLVSLDFVNSLESQLRPFLKQKQMTSKIILLNESNFDQIISLINEKWTGAIPATLIIKKQKRIFFEGLMSFEQLEKAVRR